MVDRILAARNPWWLALRALGVGSVLLAVLLLWGPIAMIGKPFAGFRVEPTLTVSAENDSSWNGPKAGLAPFDRLLSADGKPLRTTRDLYQHVTGLPVGTAVQYQALRDGKSVRVRVATQHFGVADFFRSFFPFFLAGILHILVGLVAFWLKPDSPAARAHMIFTVAVGSLLAGGCDYDTGGRLALLELFWLYLAGGAALHLGLVYPRPIRLVARWPALAVLPYLPALAGWAATVVLYRPQGHIVDPARLDAFMLYYSGVLVAWQAVAILGLLACLGVRTWRSKDTLPRTQALVALLGLLIGYVPMLIVFYLPTVAGRASGTSILLDNLAFCATALFPLAIAYGIVRHRLFDIEVVVKRTLAYTIVVATLTGAYLVTLALIGATLRSVLGGETDSTSHTAATALVAIGFAPVRDWSKALIDRLFDRTSYSLAGLIGGFGDQTRDLSDVSQVLDAFLDGVDSAMHPTYAVVLLRLAGKEDLAVFHTLGLGDGDRPRITVDDAHLVGLVDRGLAISPEPADFRPLRGALCIPMLGAGGLLGCALIGPKKSDQTYSEQDRFAMVSLARQVERQLRQDLIEKEAHRVRTVLSRYVSDKVAEVVLGSDMDVEQVKRQRVTVMFTDIRGFTKMSETMEPEAVAALLNEYFSRMVDAVLDEGGMLDKFIGDGMMAVFGAPVTSSDHERRALRAAFRMRAELAELNASRELAGEPPLAIGIGIHTGECVVGNIGTPKRLDYTAIGDTVNTASRIESLTKDFKTDILISGATFARVATCVIVRPVGDVAIRGKTRRLEIFAVEAEASAPSLDLPV